MEFISERTIGGRNFVLLEEIIERVESKKIALLLKSGKLQIFERVPECYDSDEWLISEMTGSNTDASVKSRISDDFVKCSQARRANPEE